MAVRGGCGGAGLLGGCGSVGLFVHLTPCCSKSGAQHWASLVQVGTAGWVSL